MTVVRPFAELRTSAGNLLFEGHRHGGGVQLSVFVTAFEPGQGPPLHQHPYAEVFVVQDGEATFTIDDESLVIAGGHVVVIEPTRPHAFRNSGDRTLHVLSIHPCATVVQTDLS